MGISIFWTLNLEGLTAGASLWRAHMGTIAHPLDVFGGLQIGTARGIGDFRWNFWIFGDEVGQGTVAKILSPTGLGSPHIPQSKFLPEP